jgi:hypothetical protein
MTDFEHALNTKQAAAMLGLTPGSLAVMRSRKTGPPFSYSGTKPVYYVSELRRWQVECRAAREMAFARQAEVEMQVIENKQAVLDGGQS